MPPNRSKKQSRSTRQTVTQESKARTKIKAAQEEVTRNLVNDPAGPSSEVGENIGDAYPDLHGDPCVSPAAIDDTAGNTLPDSADGHVISSVAVETVTGDTLESPPVDPNVSPAAVGRTAGNTRPADRPDNSLAAVERVTRDTLASQPSEPNFPPAAGGDTLANQPSDTNVSPAADGNATGNTRPTYNSDNSSATVERLAGNIHASLADNYCISEPGKAARKYYDKARFRCLIIGRANAGKTTILRRVCNTIEDPEVFFSKATSFNRTGELEKLDDFVVSPTTGRGLHDVELQLVFKSNRQFIFHDSRGFEYGASDEFDAVRSFVSRRANEITQDQRLHVIWYCIPMTDDSRLFTAAEEKFFNECDTYDAPVIVVFTKFDALDDVAFQDLLEKGLSAEEAEMQCQTHAMELFREKMVLDKLSGSRFPPTPGHTVFLRNLDNPASTIDHLLEVTASALDDRAVQQLFVNSQMTNLRMSTRYSIKDVCMYMYVKILP